MYFIIRRRAEFSASYRYWLSELSEIDNWERFGHCARFPPQGHHYVLYVSIQGKLDRYGLVYNLSDVKHVIQQCVTQPLDFAYLNEVWPEFEQTLPTTENLARVIWHRLYPYLPLVNIQLFEHPQLWAEYEGVNMEAFLTVGTHFSAAHRLFLPILSDEENCAIYGKCVHAHGHNYHLEITVRGDINDRTGMIVDLDALRQVLEDYVIEPLDHHFLNQDIPYFTEVVPTAENIAAYISTLLQQPIQDLGTELHRVKLIESPNNSCEILCDQPAI